MQWSNAALKEEDVWYATMANFHKELMEEVADNLNKLETNEIGVLAEKVRASAILFDDKKTVNKMEKVGRKLMEDTIQRFGEAAQEEAEEYYYRNSPEGVEKAGPSVSFDLHNPAVEKYIDSRAYQFAKETTDTLLTQLRVVWNGYLKDGIKDNKTVAELTQDVEQVFVGTERQDWFKARRIARTESIGSANMGAFFGYEEAGVPYKQWITMRDALVRDSHKEMDKEVVPMNEPFIVNGKQMMAPGDSRGGPKEIIHCRCTIMPVFAGPDEKPAVARRPSRRLPSAPKPTAAKPPVPEAVPAAPVVPPWEVLENPRDAEKALKSKYQIKWTRSDMGEGSRRFFYNAFGKEMENVLSNMNPEMVKMAQKNSIDSLWIASRAKFDELYGEKQANYVGFYRRYGTRQNLLTINAPVFDRFGSKELSKFEENKPGQFVMSKSARDTMRHEYGHHVWYSFLSGKQQQSWEEDIYMREGPKWFKKNVTVYAGKNEREAFAESFNAYFHPGYKRGWLPKKVEEFFDKNMASKSKVEKE